MQLRAPAYPLINIDPYFSVWAKSDLLNDTDTVHWTDKNNKISGIATIDGKEYRKKHTEFFTTRRQMPWSIPIVYIKKFPKFSYINSLGSFSDIYYLIYGLITLLPAFSLIWIGFEYLIK